MDIAAGQTVIAFIGLGRIGSEMAHTLINAGFDVIVSDRHREKAGPLLADGARWGDFTEAVREADVAVTALGFPEDVEHAYLDDGGIIDNAQDGALLIDMSTVSPKLSHQIATLAVVNGLHAVDAPMLGSALDARRGALTIMVGGTEEDFDAARPLLEVLGSATYEGPAGCGMLMKLAATIATACTLMGAVEALSFVRTVGLDERKLAAAVRGTPADSWVFSALVPRMIDGEFDEGVRVKHFAKDLMLALQYAEETDLSLPGTDIASKLMDLLSTAGGAEMCVQALILIYSDERTCMEHGLDWSNVTESDEFAEHDHEHGCDCGCDHD